MEVKGLYKVADGQISQPQTNLPPTNPSLYGAFNTIAEEIRLAAERVKKDSQVHSSASGIGPTIWAD